MSFESPFPSFPTPSPTSPISMLFEVEASTSANIDYRLSPDGSENTELDNDSPEPIFTESETFKALAKIDLSAEASPVPSDEQNFDEISVKKSTRQISDSLAEEFYERTENGDVVGNERLRSVHEALQFKVLDVIEFARRQQPQSAPPVMPAFHEHCNCGHASESDPDSSEDSSSSSSESDESESDEKEDDGAGKSADFTKTKDPNKHSAIAQREVTRKQHHPAGLSPELCFNEPGQLNDGPACRCSWASKQTGIRHNIFAGEQRIEQCDLRSSNLSKLHHYILKVTPDPVEQSRSATSITYNDRKYIFEGFSVFFHRKLPQFYPQSRVNKLSQEFDIVFEEERAPENFTVGDLEAFHTYMYDYVMEMYDLDRRAKGVPDGCPVYHCLPRFIYESAEFDQVEVLPIGVLLNYIVEAFQPAFEDKIINKMRRDDRLFSDVSSNLKGQVFINPATRPAAIRVDLIDKPDYYSRSKEKDFSPMLTHLGMRPTAYTYNSKPAYNTAMRKFLKTRHLMGIQGKASAEEKQKLHEMEAEIKKMKADCQYKRNVTVSVSSRGFYRTSFYPDIIQHAILVALACSHVRYHWSLETFENRIAYSFKNRTLLELALTHPSFCANYGTNPDHTRNTLVNCGVRAKSKNGIGSENGIGGHNSKLTRRKGFENLREVMSMQGSNTATLSPIHHNERLEFLGDSVIEFITTVHLFYMLTDLDEGALATYRSSLVQNKHLAIMAKKIGLQEFMLFSHGPDLCHESDFRHAMANAFEAMMAAVYLECGIDECDRIFSETLFMGTDNEKGKQAWINLPDHPLKRHNPHGDRHMIPTIDSLQRLVEFEDSIGIKFKHIRVLAKAFTRRCIGYNNLTLGHNQRLELLGDTVLQLITTDYLYKHFPNHHEGHLSLLRTCLVCNRTQGVICDDLAMANYLVIPPNARKHAHVMTIRWKERADLVESFIGALYVDRGLEYCKTFCKVCFFPRLKYFIESQRWNDPKSQLQQNCIALRDGKKDPEIPEYKKIGIEGPTNTRVYTVAVYFRNKRLAEGTGHTVHLAEMNAAENALKLHAAMFPDSSERRKDIKSRGTKRKHHSSGRTRSEN